MDLWKKIEEGIEEGISNVTHTISNLEGRVNTILRGEVHSHTHLGHDCASKHPEEHTANRYCSSFPQSNGNAKWYVDGCSYFWALSMALEGARESIYILDWWLSPELYLRRPPSRNEQYRIDNMLKAAAERGVKVKIIVYKEVENVLTLKSIHTKHYLESLHPNIGVFRHPDHAPKGYDIKADLENSFSNLSLNSLKTFDLAKASSDALKALYGTSDEIVLFWAHHEKLCIVDNKIAFMGGLDACFGRWDTNSHPIADAHPGDLNAIVFPGQDYNNARVYDFSDVDKWDQNKLDRNKCSRMGWSDVALSLSGPIVGSLITHFVDRWNYIYRDKYHSKDGAQYKPLSANGREADNVSEAPVPRDGGEHDTLGLGRLQRHLHHGMSHLLGGDEGHHRHAGPGSQIQLTRSCTFWSGGHPTEHSIANAYIDAITNAEHFVYIENQFFITATSHKQDPVVNQLGLAMVERIVRAHEEGQNFKLVVVMPAVPAFAGDLQANDALGTRAIMEYQYHSINRGGYSIMETLRRRGVDDVGRYIAFFNLRNYDRINVSSTMSDAEANAGVSYEQARREYDNRAQGWGRRDDSYERYQEAASRVQDDSWDSVAACYMENGPDLNNVPWNGSEEDEFNAFVSEELYIHTKVLIADDRLVICGSANLNDRSQLGDHDSEIAVVIEEPNDQIDSEMDGRPYRVSKFASSLRRFLFRKHLGLVPHQKMDNPNDNWTPVSSGLNQYDWGSHADQLVKDPICDRFWDLWTRTARTNTEVFSKVFHNVPNDRVRTWDDYDDFFSKYFIMPGEKKEKEDSRGKVMYGHVVPDEFPGGVREVKDWLNRVRGNLVQMPLQFLIDVEDLAKQGLSLNSFTDEIYT